LLLKIHLTTGQTSSITIVDLAGSERARSSTQSAPERRREAAQINASLSALKACVRARVAGERAPWREDRLTMVLRRAFEDSSPSETETEAVAGQTLKAKLIIIACASPSVVDAEDTLATLNYVAPLKVEFSVTPFKTVLCSPHDVNLAFWWGANGGSRNFDIE
jgi:kinesin family protein 2/24